MEARIAHEERVQAEVRALARMLRRHRLEDVAALFIEMHRPLRGLMENLLVVGAPLLSPFVGSALYQKFRLIIETPGAIDALERAIHNSEVGEHGGA